MKNIIKQINVSIAPLFRKSIKSSELINELLFGECVEILDENNNWFFCKSTFDNYKGWIQKKNLSNVQVNTHKVLLNNVIVFAEPSEKSFPLFNLSLGSSVKRTKRVADWIQIQFTTQHKQKNGYIHFSNLEKINFKTIDWVIIAETFINTPYKWGGRSFLGIDCSALVQVSLLESGISIPRDTFDQVNLNFTTIKNLNDLRRGDLVFWKGHVGIMQNKIEILHSNATYMKVTSEKLLLTRNRYLNLIGDITSMLRPK
jgi:hypothetical protein